MKLMTYNRVLNISGANLCSIFVNVLNPFFVLAQAVGRDANNLNITFGEVIRATSDFTEFSGANRSEISWMRKEDSLKQRHE